MTRTTMRSITEADEISNKICNALDPDRPSEIIELGPNRWKVISKKPKKGTEDDYLLQSEGSAEGPTDCTCPADEYYDDCRHKTLLRIHLGLLAIPRAASNYRTNSFGDTA